MTPKSPSPTAQEASNTLTALPRRHPRHEKRVLDVFVGGQHRQQVETLEDEAEVLGAKVRELVIGKRLHGSSANHDRAGVSAGRCSRSVEQRRFSAADGPEMTVNRLGRMTRLMSTNAGTSIASRR
jgi:hypothetical protein